MPDGCRLLKYLRDILQQRFWRRRTRQSRLMWFGGSVESAVVGTTEIADEQIYYWPFDFSSSVSIILH